MKLPFMEMGKTVDRACLGRTNKEFSFKLVKFKMPTGPLSEDTRLEVG